MGRDDTPTRIFTLNRVISIHAPRVGRDGNSLLRRSSFRYFNPRAPCGARHYLFKGIAVGCKFQSTRPVWGATTYQDLTALGDNISIHAPRVGRDPALLPSEGFTWISIHAPRVGRDSITTARKYHSINFNPRAPCGARQHQTHKKYTKDKFQSTRPVWGATIATTTISTMFKISIHAPRVGRDLADIGRHFVPLGFQSTRPVWGATPLACPYGRGRYDFNPRAPCGARLSFSSWPLPWI